MVTFTTDALQRIVRDAPAGTTSGADMQAAWTFYVVQNGAELQVTVEFVRQAACSRLAALAVLLPRDLSG